MTGIFLSIMEIVVTRGIIIKTLNFHLTLHTNTLTTLGYAYVSAEQIWAKFILVEHFCEISRNKQH